MSDFKSLKKQIQSIADTSFPDLISDYKISRLNTSDALLRWKIDPMSFYQNQLNFAIYCAITGCGVGIDILNSNNRYVEALFNFSSILYG